ncbi:MAG: hypothetical protein Q4B77_03880 [Coriobacteriaceae bacterium]|nr:hypothetical protein [Coriobacteriaceae bacterium]
MPYLLALIIIFLLMLVAACVDARSRRFPFALFIALACTCLLASWLRDGPRLVAVNALMALGVCGTLVLLELAWRAFHQGAAGLGMGDIKYLFAVMLWRPMLGIASVCGGLFTLAVCGVILRRPSLPLLPFAVPVAFVFALATHTV